jgi:hypothetical protein
MWAGILNMNPWLNYIRMLSYGLIWEYLGIVNVHYLESVYKLKSLNVKYMICYLN